MWLLTNLQDTFSGELEVGTSQDLHEIKAALPDFQATFVYTGE